VNWLRHVLSGVHAELAQTPIRRTVMDARSGRPGPFRTTPRDLTLVNALKSDHRKLLEIHARIGRLMSERRYIDIPGQLIALRMRLETHVLTENVRLYAFLEHLFQGDSGRLAELAELRADTNAVLLAVLKFVKQHRRTTFDESSLFTFAETYTQIGALLARHMAREERDLYRLYPLA